MIDCRECEMLMNYPIKVVDVPAKHFLDNDIIHFENGFKCMWNGVESLNIEALQKKNCRCKGENSGRN